ncbi:hypothetical protein GCM10017667_12900 [Streptomyces filamentosus]|uniref:Uncharacterized protein n=1 Tax=Streptomyces filamentosus TaxID=67294 RepID=A0A919BGH5_STRFL|nr:hypothetical protein GCM10017667_12900 [Streptomyces filamentosus]
MGDEQHPAGGDDGGEAVDEGPLPVAAGVEDVHREEGRHEGRGDEQPRGRGQERQAEGERGGGEGQGGAVVPCGGPGVAGGASEPYPLLGVAACVASGLRAAETVAGAGAVTMPGRTPGAGTMPGAAQASGPGPRGR